MLNKVRVLREQSNHIFMLPMRVHSANAFQWEWSAIYRFLRKNPFPLIDALSESALIGRIKVQCDHALKANCLAAVSMNTIGLHTWSETSYLHII